MRVFAVVALVLCSLSATHVSASDKHAQRWISAATGDESGPYFVAYFWNGTAWQGWDCNPGSTYTVVETNAACIAETSSVTAIVTTCASGSLLVGPSPIYTYTCPGGACDPGIIFDDLSQERNVTIISCQGSQPFTFTMYRATTHPLATTTLSSKPESLGLASARPTSPISLGFVTSTGSSTISTSGTTSESTGAATAANGNSSNGIGLGIGIGIGVPAILVALAAWWFPRHPQWRGALGRQPETEHSSEGTNGPDMQQTVGTEAQGDSPPGVDATRV